jgi:hypothetical protein
VNAIIIPGRDNAVTGAAGAATGVGTGLTDVGTMQSTTDGSKIYGLSSSLSLAQFGHLAELHGQPAANPRE